MSVDLEREKLSTLVASFMSYSAGHLPDDVRTRLAEMREIENEGSCSWRRRKRARYLLEA